jgi:hypothetical protein
MLLRGETHTTLGVGDRYAFIDEQVRALRMALIDDLSSHWFKYVPSSDALLMSPGPHFGEPVHEKFSEARDDINAAARCLGLREGDACVFHLMRVLEHGLHALAKDLNVPMVPTLELENWHNIIEQIQSKITSEINVLAQQKKKAALPVDKIAADKRMQRLADIAKEFGSFKEAWRNYVSHTKVTFDPHQARSVWNHVSEFMRKMAADL